MHTEEYFKLCIEYLGEIKTKFENTLPCLSGAQRGSNHGKKIEVENLVTFSLYLKDVSNHRAT